MQIKEIMTRDVISVSPETDISKISDILYTNRFHGVPVIDKDKLIVGLITESDFFLKKYDDIYFPTYIKFMKESRMTRYLPEELKKDIEALLKSAAKDIMTADPITFSSEDDVAALMEKVKETKFTTFPVVDETKRLIGIITLADYLGTVRKNSRQMENRLQNDSVRNIDRMASGLGDFWQDRVMIVSKKKIRTWKGLTFLGLATVILLAISLVFITKNQVSCAPEGGNFSPLECQQYIYGTWSQCGPQNTQTREIEKKFPPNCSGGAIPILIQPCQQ
ncbi:MAG: CBS domain-containing protein [Parcubacteria group bacterium]